VKINMVIGSPIEQSLSPLIHNAGIRALNLENLFTYWAVKVEESQLESFFNSVKKLPVRGISVTLPHKISVLKYLNNIDEDAQKIGAVNTIVIDNQQLFGHNTDWIGIYNPLKNKNISAGKSVLILGAGGASRSAVYAAYKLGLNITVTNRTIEKVSQLRDICEISSIKLLDLKNIDDYDIIINTTPLGMYPNTELSPLENYTFNKEQIVFDCVYNPLETKLLRNAKEHSAQIIYGIDMFIEQALEQFYLYTGHRASYELFKSTLQEKL
jgi:shikimate dehydrogenase